MSDSASDAAQVARGSGMVFVGGLTDRSLRLVNSWLLTWGLGVTGFGLYTYAVTVVSLLSVFAGLGLNNGMVYFGARHRADDAQPQLKGMLVVGGLLTVGCASLVAVALAAGAGLGWFWPGQPDTSAAVLVVAPAIALLATAQFVVAALQAAKDMRSSALAYQVALPLTMVVGAVVVLALGFGVRGVLAAFVAATAVSLLAAVGFARRHYGHLWRDRVRATVHLGPMLRFSLPQSLATMVYQLNRWLDVLMLSWLATYRDIGLYRVALALALMGNLPIVAVITTVRPMVAEMLHRGEAERLDRLLKAVARWLLVVSAPIYVGVFLVPEVPLAIFRPEFQDSRGPLLVLMGGQAVYILCAAAMPLIAMSGRSGLFLANGVVAVSLNAVLNLWLIPDYQATGAAVASASALAFWAALHVVEARILVGASPVSRHTLAMVTYLVAASIGVRLLADGVAMRGVGAVLVMAGFATVVWWQGQTPEDAVVVARIKQAIHRLRSG